MSLWWCWITANGWGKKKKGWICRQTKLKLVKRRTHEGKIVRNVSEKQNEVVSKWKLLDLNDLRTRRQQKFTSKLNVTWAARDRLKVIFHIWNYQCCFVIPNLRLQRFTFVCKCTFLKHCSPPMKLWDAKYSCISVWNDMETVWTWRTLQLRGGSAHRQRLTEIIRKAF